jgi:hypothetical protein
LAALHDLAPDLGPELTQEHGATGKIIQVSVHSEKFAMLNPLEKQSC